MRRDVFQAIADPIRREIIDLLSKKTLTVNAVAENFEISRPAVSKHIRILKECGLVSTKKVGREQYCSLHPENLAPVSDWIEQHKRHWGKNLDSFESYLNKLKEENLAPIR